MNDFKAVGLTLSDEDYRRLKRFADDRHWSLARAARLIVTQRLDQYEATDPEEGRQPGGRG